MTTINWDELNKAVIPINGYEDLYKRSRKSLEYPILRKTFNYSIPELVEYVRLGLGEDLQDRYKETSAKLIWIFTNLKKAGNRHVLDLIQLVSTHQSLQDFCDTTGMHALDIVSAVKYLIYWFIPIEKYFSGLIRTDPQAVRALKALHAIGVRTNLDLLQQGYSKAGRVELVEKSGLPQGEINTWVNRADFSRMPWASKATIANIMGAGYGSLAQLAAADPDQVSADYYRFGKSFGKNLKLGNEIENCQRIARILPRIVQND